eukprot:6998120-Pyramimonas_sp.AAC.1
MASGAAGRRGRRHCHIRRPEPPGGGPKALAHVYITCVPCRHHRAPPVRTRECALRPHYTI